jgi:DNA-binding HxlR family transcriptional regulator
MGERPIGEPGPHEAPECSIARTLEVIGDRWTILVLRDCFKGIRRFDEIRRDLDIARPVLADRLKRLVAHGVLERRLYQQRPNRYEYRLTPMGVELSPILVALMRWGDKHLAGEEGPPTVLVHKPCGHELRQGFYCASCRQTFSPSAIGSRPGPGGSRERTA